MVVRRGAAELGASVPDEVEELIARRAGGDARDGAQRSSSSPSQTARAEGVALAERHVEDAARKRPLALRQGRRRALRLHLGVDQVDARERRASVRLLPRGDARRRRGRALHRAADDRARLRGHRQRRPAGAARRGRRGAGGRARRPAGGAAEPRAGGRLPRAGAEVERAYLALSAATQDVRERGHLLPPAALRSAHYPGARKLGRGEGYVYPHDDPRGLRGRLPARTS